MIYIWLMRGERMICSICQFLWSRCHWSQNWQIMYTIDWWVSFSSPPGTAITHLWLCLVLVKTANVIMKVQASGYKNVQRLWKSEVMLWVGIMRGPRNNMLVPGQHVRPGSHLGAWGQGWDLGGLSTPKYLSQWSPHEYCPLPQLPLSFSLPQPQVKYKSSDS